MTTPRTLAVVGASLAGAKAAEAAREAGFEGRIMLIGEEPGLPYERPPLSKSVLRGEKAPDSAAVHADGFYVDNNIELVADRAIALDVGARRLDLARGSRVAFDTAVVATGAFPRRLSMAGANLEGVHYLRTIQDALELRAAIQGSARVAVIGGGWIGCEVAASAREMGAEVVLIDPSAVPLQRVLGEAVGAFFGRLHATHGVDLRLGTGVRSLEGRTAVDALVLEDGRVEAADAVVVGIGVLPRTDLADGSVALSVDDGLVTDRHLETTVSGIYAAGDVASAFHPHYRRHLRVEHWDNAVHQGETAGRNAVGGREAYTRLPYFFSDQYDLGLEYVGHGGAGDSVVIRGELESREFIAFWHRDGVLTAAMNVNTWDVIDELRALVAAATPIDLERLADPDVPLASLQGAS